VRRWLNAYIDRTKAIREFNDRLWNVNQNVITLITQGSQKRAESESLMDIHIHHHHYIEPQSLIVGKLDRLETLLETIRQEAKAMHVETKQLVTELNEATNAVAARIETLIANAEGGLTKEEAIEHNAELTVLRDQLRAMGANPANPLPPLPPPV